MKSSCRNVLYSDSDRLVENRVCGLVECSCRKLAWSRVRLTLVFRKVVDGEVNLIVCAYVYDLAVTAKDKETFDAFYAQLKEEFPVNDTGDIFLVPCVRFRA